MLPFNTPAFICDEEGRIVSCTQGALNMMKTRLTGRALSGELAEPVTAEPLKKAIKQACQGTDSFHVKAMFITGEGNHVTLLANVFKGISGHAEVVAAGEDPFACLWEKEEEEIPFLTLL